jgi:hypothetical protein
VSEAERILIARHRHARRSERKLDRRRPASSKGIAAGRTLAQRENIAAAEAEPRTPWRSAGRSLCSVAAAAGSWMRKAANIVYGVVGYGYRPGRLFWALIALISAVVVLLLIPSFQDTLRASNGNGDVYSTMGLIRPSISAPEHAGHRDTCQDGQVRCFSIGLYAIDTVVPLISLDQRSTWYPDQHVPDGMFVAVALDIATVLGWILSSIFVLSFARFARSNR